MTKVVSLILTCTLMLMFVSAPVSAHVLITSGSIGATLHIDPDDDPIAGALSTFFLEFKDLEGKFSLAKCRCQAFIYDGEKELYFESLGAVNASAPLSSAFLYKFPKTGSYKLVIKGDPIQAEAFQSFEMSEMIAVERLQTESGTTRTQSYLQARWQPIAAVALVAGVIATAVIVRNRKLNPRKK